MTYQLTGYGYAVKLLEADWTIYSSLEK